MSPAELIAKGWADLEVTHFSAASGPYWVRRDAEGVAVGLLSEEKHSNGHLGTVHGGVLMSFADIALGVRVTEAIGAPLCATSQLSFSFVGAAIIGSFITCRPELVRKTSQLVFVRGLFRAGDRTIGTADGIFSILDQAKLDGLRGSAG